MWQFGRKVNYFILHSLAVVTKLLLSIVTGINLRVEEPLHLVLSCLVTMVLLSGTMFCCVLLCFDVCYYVLMCVTMFWCLKLCFVVWYHVVLPWYYVLLFGTILLSGTMFCCLISFFVVYYYVLLSGTMFCCPFTKFCCVVQCFLSGTMFCCLCPLFWIKHP